MIEGHIAPAGRRVTLRTVRAECAIVMVVLLMAAHTILRRAFEDVVDVAGGTRHADVRASQLERRQVVIEGHIAPAGRRVALRAVRAERAVVMIVLLMAAHTILRRAFEDTVDVTGGTRHADVRTG